MKVIEMVEDERAKFEPEQIGTFMIDEWEEPLSQITIRHFVEYWLRNELSVCRVTDIYLEKLKSLDKQVPAVVITGQDILYSGLVKECSPEFADEIIKWYAVIPRHNFTEPYIWRDVCSIIMDEIHWQRSD